MIVWGGGANGEFFNTGAKYDPIDDGWMAISIVNAPIGRALHSAAWTGTEMIVWGGYDYSTWYNTGGKYNPATDSWVAMSTTNAPERRWYHTVEWTGGEMVVWGGTNQTIALNTGGKYNPTTDSWTATRSCERARWPVRSHKYLERQRNDHLGWVGFEPQRL